MKVFYFQMFSLVNLPQKLRMFVLSHTTLNYQALVAMAVVQKSLLADEHDKICSMHWDGKIVPLCRLINQPI